MTIFLGLGANEGDRRGNLESAIEQLVAAGFQLQQVSPVVESPAMLPTQADPAWHKPYLNLVISGDAAWQPRQALALAKQIEKSLGRTRGARWSPRPIDIDLLVWHDQTINSESLTIPHVGLTQRNFALTPLMHLQPDLVLGENDKTVFELTHSIRPVPLWMAIINLTPDSFSSEGFLTNETSRAGNNRNGHGELDAYLDKLIEQNVQIIDIGAESTRPRGHPVSLKDEWSRLEPVLESIAGKLEGKRVKPWLSLDSRHPAIIEKAMDYGVDMINDVTGLGDPDMMALVRQSGCQAVAMHSLSVPVDPVMLLPDDRSAVSQINQWLQEKMETWVKAGLDLNRIILDPGIGFGKSSIQAFELLSHCRDLRQAGLRLLIGHSRKSFMSGLTARPAGQRDPETLGMSLSLCQQGVDIIRVHSPFIHIRAYRAWAHVAPD